MNKFNTILFGLVLLLCTGQANAVLIGLEPSLQDAQPGDLVSLDLVIDGTDGSLGNLSPESVSSWRVGLLFDSTALSFYAVEFFDLGEPTNSYFNVSSVGPGEFQLEGYDASFVSGPDAYQSDRFTLARLIFDVVDLLPGTNTLVEISDPLGPAIAPLSVGLVTEVLGTSGNPVPISAVFDATIQNPQVTSVPEPTTLALLSLGLAGLGFTRRRMKS